MRGYTQEDVAILTRMSRTFVGDLERAQKNASILSLQKLASTLKVTPALLITPKGHTLVDKREQ